MTETTKLLKPAASVHMELAKDEQGRVIGVQIRMLVLRKDAASLPAPYAGHALDMLCEAIEEYGRAH